MTAQNSIVRIGLLQFAMTSDMEQNLHHAIKLIESAAKQGAQITCLPELFRTPYFCTAEKCERDYTEQDLNSLTETLSNVAAKNKVVLVAGSIYEHNRDSDKKFNTSLVFNSDGKLLGHYRKTHIPHDPAFYERNYFAEGDTGFKVFNTAYGKIAVLICYDQWFPEAARCCALAGAEIIFYPTAIGTVKGIAQDEGNWQEAWESVQRGHAVANNVVVAAVNRVGTEGDSTFWGGSFCYTGFGTLLGRAGDKEQILIIDADLSISRNAREGWRFFHSRRPDCYRLITS
jgi:agmatine deiminase